MAKKRSGGAKTKQPSKEKLAPPASGPYRVLMTATAEAVYVEMARRARQAEEKGDVTNANCTAFHMVRDTIKNIIPANPIDRGYALTGDLANIFRIQKGRMRICWIASSKHRELIIMFISETLRKAGDVNDPYSIFARMVMSGQFNEFFERLGVKPPKQAVAAAIMPRIQ